VKRHRQFKMIEGNFPVQSAGPLHPQDRVIFRVLLSFPGGGEQVPAEVHHAVVVLRLQPLDEGQQRGLQIRLADPTARPVLHERVAHKIGAAVAPPRAILVGQPRKLSRSGIAHDFGRRQPFFLRDVARKLEAAQAIVQLSARSSRFQQARNPVQATKPLHSWRLTF
jgi:hypothetical protein